MSQEELEAFINVVLWITIKAIHRWTIYSSYDDQFKESHIDDELNTELEKAVKAWISTRDI